MKRQLRHRRITQNQLRPNSCMDRRRKKKEEEEEEEEEEGEGEEERKRKKKREKKKDCQRRSPCSEEQRIRFKSGR